MYPQVIQQLIADEHLPTSYGEDAQKWFVPLIEELRGKIENSKPIPLLLGINGAQGTGKSTLGKLIKACLEDAGYPVTVLSIDDFYLGKLAREALAQEVHPLLTTRGVPGTHDTDRLAEVLSRLKQGELGRAMLLPKFDKAEDDTLPDNACPLLEEIPQLVILEGWFVGVSPQTDEDLLHPVNQLESEEDENGIWRRFVNCSLANEYSPIFAMLDSLILLKAPSFELVYTWRGLQEKKLRDASDSNSAGLMDDKQLRRFIQHYERLTRHCLATLPALANTVFELDENHRIRNRLDP